MTTVPSRSIVLALACLLAAGCAGVKQAQQQVIYPRGQHQLAVLDRNSSAGVVVHVHGAFAVGFWILLPA
jgi:type IV pilus biogenesis protein CpaD/CtpE